LQLGYGPAMEADLQTELELPDRKLHVEHYAPAGSPHLRLVMTHGYSAHCGLYRHVGRTLAERGIAATFFDLRGHGRSSGRRGHVDDFAEYRADLAAVVDWSAARHPSLPCVLMAHSMGCVVTVDYVSATPEAAHPSAVVLLAPWFLLKMKVPGWKRSMGKLTARLWPALSMANGLRAEDVTRNPVAIDGFWKDPLVFHVATARWFACALATQARIRDGAAQWKTRTLMLLAGEDRIVCNNANRAFAQAAGPSVTLREYPGYFHEIFLEAEAAGAAGHVADWLLSSRG
jgi:lysophospholipase